MVNELHQKMNRLENLNIMSKWNNFLLNFTNFKAKLLELHP
jgi:hypothetical protein